MSAQRQHSASTPLGGGGKEPNSQGRVTSLIETNSTGCHFTQKRCFSLPFHDNSLSHGAQTQQVLLRRVEQTLLQAGRHLPSDSFLGRYNARLAPLPPGRTLQRSQAQQELPVATIKCGLRSATQLLQARLLLPTLTLLPQLRFALLDSRHHHVTHTSCRQSVQAALDPLHGDDVQILGTCGEKSSGSVPRCHACKDSNHPITQRGKQQRLRLHPKAMACTVRPW